MTNGKQPLPAMAGVNPTTKYTTALRIAMNIAIADPELTRRPAATWPQDRLYAHLEEHWGFTWNEDSQLWKQQ